MFTCTSPGRLSTSLLLVGALALSGADARAEGEAAPAEAPAAEARRLAKEGKPAEAAAAWLRAADETPARAPELRHEAAMARQRAGDLAGAREQHQAVSGDQMAPVALRVLSRDHAGLLYWFDEFSTIYAASEGELATLRADTGKLALRANAFIAGAEAGAAKLKSSRKRLEDNRKKLVDFMGADDPMVGELDALLAAYDENREVAADVAAGLIMARQEIKAIVAAVGALEKATAALAKALGASQVTLEKGETKLKKLRKQIVDKTGKVAGQAVAALHVASGGGGALARALDRLEPKLEAVTQVVGVADLLLGEAE